MYLRKVYYELVAFHNAYWFFVILWGFSSNMNICFKMARENEITFINKHVFFS